MARKQRLTVANTLDTIINCDHNRDRMLIHGILGLLETAEMAARNREESLIISNVSNTISRLRTLDEKDWKVLKARLKLAIKAIKGELEVRRSTGEPVKLRNINTQKSLEIQNKLMEEIPISSITLNSD